MIQRSFDRGLLEKASECVRYMMPKEALEEFWNTDGCMMFVEGDNVGLATKEYAGVYSVHWYYRVRGREAINLARRMMKNLFDNYGAETIRGLVRTELKASRWGARQAGLKSYGVITFANGEENELFCITKDEFNG